MCAGLGSHNIIIHLRYLHAQLSIGCSIKFRTLDFVATVSEAKPVLSGLGLGNRDQHYVWHLPAGKSIIRVAGSTSILPSHRVIAA
jgi:hypothetical protein